MKRIYAIVAVAGLVVTGAAAQDEFGQKEKMRVEVERVLANGKVIGIEAGVMGNPVKNAPYTAEEVVTSTQTLADGTNIRNESTTTVYRDSEGRIRRETPNEIVLMDPVANSRVAWSPKDSTGSKSSLAFTSRLMVAGDGGRAVRFMTEPGMVPPPPPPPGEGNVVFSLNASPTSAATTLMRHVDKVALAKSVGKVETLNPQILEGLNAEGTRNTMTIETGSVGNDRPIYVISERWYSPELQLVVQSKTTDPRTGEQTFQLRNVRRGEPDPSLFQAPANLQINNLQINHQQLNEHH